eukprot:TRINITY_DN3908_c0_g1_i17.p1 TRINITY_DN3908_c0_g1~~TRINITY_DN3908_c0_g1_i17.p1  ORF type:complete len:143 (-),score=49.15 TRINITY_DN3908_c0_g1_i17:531-905(-)
MAADKDDVGVRKVQARTILQDRKRPHHQQKDSDDDDDSEFDPKTVAPLKRQKKQKIENQLKELPPTTNNEGNKNTKQRKIDASCQTIQQNQEKVNKSQQDDSSENEDDWLDEEDEDCDYYYFYY